MKTKHGEKIDFRFNMKEYLRLIKKYKWQIVVLLIFSLAIEASYVTERYLFKIITDNGTAFAGKEILANALVQALLAVAVVFIMLVAVRTVSKWVFIHLINTIENNAITDLKRHYFNHIIGLSHSFHSSHRTGSPNLKADKGRLCH